MKPYEIVYTLHVEPNVETHVELKVEFVIKTPVKPCVSIVS